jgi:tRNA-specific 2-thiouridylase
VACNRDVKFDFLLKRARSLGAKLATGHYARIVRDGERLALARGLDPAKDQSYFLFTLGQDALADLIFPVGELTKAQVREVAVRHSLPTSHKPESMEICFVPDGDYAGFVERVAGPQPKGDIVDAQGTVLGEHEGIHRFTVGQRRGLGVSSANPLYVQRIDPQTRQVVVGPAAEAERRSFRLMQPHWVSAPPEATRPLMAKIRHRHAGAAARVRLEDDGHFRVELDVPARAVTPGQAAVFYDGEQVVGGGWIA